MRALAVAGLAAVTGRPLVARSADGVAADKLVVLVVPLRDARRSTAVSL